MKKLYVKPAIKIEVILNENKVNYYEIRKGGKVRVEGKKDGWTEVEE